MKNETLTNLALRFSTAAGVALVLAACVGEGQNKSGPAASQETTKTGAKSSPGGSQAASSGSDSSDKTVGTKVGEFSDKVMEDAERTMFDTINKKALDVDFVKNKFYLSKNEKRDIKVLLQSQDYSLFKAYVAAWSDAGPMTEAKTSNLDLAKSRLMEIEKYVKSIGFKGTIVTVNMVENSNRMEETLGTESSDIRGAVENPSGDTKMRHVRLAKILRSKGGSGKAVLVFAP